MSHYTEFKASVTIQTVVLYATERKMHHHLNYDPLLKQLLRCERVKKKNLCISELIKYGISIKNSRRNFRRIFVSRQVRTGKMLMDLTI